MKKLQVLAILLLGLILACQGSKTESSESNSYAIIPKPVKLEKRSGQFHLSEQTTIISAEENIGNEAYLKELLGSYLDQKSEQGSENTITLNLDERLEDPEAYTLDITPERILIKGGSPAGVFYGIQTLRQLLPAEIEAKEAAKDLKLSVPCAYIEDAPRFDYRGMHLDVGRHFFPVDFIKKYIDLLAMHKMNRFHWHLTEDQGWRIEIKQYPKLQEISAYRKETVVGHNNDTPRKYDGKRYGGYYTQEEVKEVVAYAQSRHVTVIPEIEMPGHSQAVLAAYPELACTEGPFEVATHWGVFEEVYCPKEETFEFLENVLTEVIELFPSEYIHIGGDECPKKRWEESAFVQDLIKREGLEDEHGVQSWFIQRMEKFLNEKGRNIIGWDEILEGGLAPNATVMSWRGMEGGIAAAKQGHDVIMTPTSFCYLDYYQSRSSDEPLAIGGYLPLEKVYSFEPVPEELNEEEAKHILGAQGNLWTEYIATPEKAEYMAFPRGIALAEVSWSPKSSKDYNDFTSRLAQHLKRLDVLNVNYGKQVFDVKADISGADNRGLTVRLSSKLEDGNIYYTIDGSQPTAASTTYSSPVSIQETVNLKAQTFLEGQPLGNILDLNLQVHKASGKKVSLTNPPHQNYSLGGKEALVNGIMASDDRFGDGEWLAWQGENLDATIDLGVPTELSTITMRFFHDPGPWIYSPQSIHIYLSKNGQEFSELISKEVTAPEERGSFQVTTQLPEETKGRYIRMEVIPHGVIEEDMPGAGSQAWLFVDEIIVE